MVRLLWVYEYLTPPMQELAEIVANHPEIELEIMTRNTELRDVPLIPLECRNKVDFRARRAIREQVIRGNYDLVHCYTSRNLANTLAACSGLKPRPQVIGYRGTINRLSRLDPANWITFWHPGVSAITCVCNATRRALLASGISEHKLHTVWEGCSPAALSKSKQYTRADFDIPEDAFVVGTVASIRPVKGMHLLLEAVRSDLADLENLYVLLIGDVIDKEVEQLGNDPRLASRVRLPGRIPRGGGCAGLFDVYAAPSLMEGLSMSIMESMTKEVCPLVSDAGGNVELIRDQQDGLVVPTGDASALGVALRRLHDHPELRAAYAASAHQRARDVFSVPQWGQRLIDTYLQVAQGSGMRKAA